MRLNKLWLFEPAKTTNNNMFKINESLGLNIVDSDTSGVPVPAGDICSNSQFFNGFQEAGSQTEALKINPD